MKKYFILLLVLTCLIGRASAYIQIAASNGQMPAWPSMPIPFWINQSGSPQISNGSEFDAVKAAFQTWQNVPIANVSFQYKGTTPVPTVGQDGLNVITFVDDSVPLGSEAIASTFSFFTVDGTGTLVIQEADIAVSTTFQFSTAGDPDKYDIQSVLTHEVGHFLGLDHSALLSSVMSPYPTAGQLDQRTLSYDDLAGVASIYPQNSDGATLGALFGLVTLSGTPMSGAHVVALDANGNVIASTISFPDGSYEIGFLQPGSYRVYAEPLDGPVTEQNIGGTATSFYSGLNTNFSTTYFGDTSDLTKASTLFVTAGRLNSSGNIHVLPASSLNQTAPGTYAMHIPLGGQTNLTVGGAGLISGDTFSISDSGISVGIPAYGGSISSAAPTSAQLPISVGTTVTTGPKNIAVSAGGVTSVLSGSIVVVNPQPSGILVAPNSGTVDGLTAVSITGQNFRSGAQVYFGGLAASNVQVVSPTTIQATVPPNAAGAANVVVVNSDGTWGVTTAAFSYTALPPQITSVSPLSGPPSTVVAISGSEFTSRIADMDVRFNGTSANIVSTSRTSISVLVPPAATTGTITVSAAGQTATGPVFTVTSPAASTNLALLTTGFIDATAGGTTLAFGNNDDAAAVATLPFAFTLFDKAYALGSTIAISTNGWMSLDAFTQPQFANSSLPNASMPPALIAPFFDDLALHANSNVTVRTIGAAPNRQFVVEWLNAGILDEQGNDLGASITFEAVLYEGSNDIQFIYRSLAGPRSDGSSATIGIQNSARTQAVQTGFNQAIVSTGAVIGYHPVNGVYVPIGTAPPAGLDTRYSIAERGGMSVTTDGSGANTATGFAAVQPDTSNTAPAGIAIFGYKPGSVLVSEAAVPASPLLQKARVYAEIGGPVNTGLAIANPNSSPASINFYFTDSAGNDSASGTIIVPANGHIAKFLNDPAFNSVTNFQGTFTFSSNLPVAVIALRGFTNQRSEFLMSTLPVADLSATAANTTAVLPHFADGGGWKTQIILVNPTDSPMTGNISFFTSSGQSISTSPFSIPKHSSFKQVTPGTAPVVQSGLVQVVPDSGNNTPVSVAIFSNSPNGVTVSETAVLPAAATALRTYVEVSGTSGAIGSINSGLALGNTTASPVTVSLGLTDLNGNGLSSTSLVVPAGGQVARFLNEIFPNVAVPLKGVLRVTANSPIALAALRGRYNERGDFLMSTTPPTVEALPAATAPLIFPHIVNGGGFTTQFILFSGAANQTANGDLHLTYEN